ncbi:hypothetical protein PPUN109347_13730 [Pseudomonas putida]|nr:hypothetical protein PPUN109347_13730 [Pseudomonas putida]
MGAWGFKWGRCAHLRGHARSYRYRVAPDVSQFFVGAGVPAKGCNAAPKNLENERLFAYWLSTIGGFPLIPAQ